jgi:hypothetical protein
MKTDDTGINSAANTNSLNGIVRQDLRYSRKEIVPVEIEAWVTHRNDCFVKYFSDPKGKDWKASVRHINGVMEWEWCATLEEAVAWCNKYFLPNNCFNLIDFKRE